MKRFVDGEDRTQGVLLPEFLDDYVAEDNPVRAIDVFVDELDLPALGFEGVVPETTGRPAYHPATMLKIYVYGYINQVQSSRPSFASVAAIAAAIDDGSVRSMRTANASRPIAAAAASSASVRMSASATLAPSAASCSAVARPTPPAAPVIRMRRPSCRLARVALRTGNGA